MCTAAEPLVCNLGALSAADQMRRATLADLMLGRTQQIAETADGFALRLDPELAGETLEWVRLERACCPFLRFELRFEAHGGPLWLGLGGGPEVKAFLAASGLAARACCGAT
jgi:hypothetical protein